MKISRLIIIIAAIMAFVSPVVQCADNRVNPSEIRETYVGSSVADAMRAALGADAAFINGSSIGYNDLPQALNKQTVSKIVPFSNEAVVLLKISGSSVLETLEQSYRLLPRRSSSFLQVSGISFSVDENQPEGKRVGNVKISGKSIDPAKKYLVATTDFLSTGGGGLKALRAGEPATKKSTPIGEILLNNMRYDSSKIDSVPGRINIIPLKD
ncbi:MAG TPA: 5'-nucleotidase [bacterium]|nr:5'-nucleotidase [bacterium]